MIDLTYVDTFNCVSTSPGPRHRWAPATENGILFNAYYEYLGGERLHLTHSIVLGGLLRQHFMTDKLASHDNITAFIWLFRDKIYDIGPFPKYKRHPRDWIFFFNFKGYWWAKPLLPILSIIMIWSCLPWKKKRPFFLKRWWIELIHKHEGDSPKPGLIQHNYRTRDGEHLVTEEHESALDGKLLNFLRLDLLPMPRTAKIMDKLCQWFYVDDSYGIKFFYDFFGQDKNHPIIIEARKRKPRYFDERNQTPST